MLRRPQGSHLIPLAILLLIFFAALSLQSPQAAAEPLAQKEIPHDLAGKDDCLMCHKIGGMKPFPANHASYDNKTCMTCHKVKGAAQPTQAAQPAQPTAQPKAASGPEPIPHDLVGKDDCLMCHKIGALKPFPANHASYDNKICVTCHQPAAAQPTQPAAQPTRLPAQPTQAPVPATQPPAQPTAAAAIPAQPSPTPVAGIPGAPDPIPHQIEGRAACSTCHGVAGVKPYPKDHIGRPDSGCTQCHVVAPAKAPGGGTALPAGNETCLSCHKQTDLSMTLASGQKLSLYIDGEQFAQSVHGGQGMQCLTCHPTSATYPHPPVTAKNARELNRGIMQQSCATCHKDIYNTYKESVHGKALIEENNLDVPSCTDCHGVHNIRDPKTGLFRLHSPDTCSACHGNAQLMGKYGISANVTRTYLNDFHGATVRLQSDLNNPNITSYKAVCYDCHGIHDIKMTDDPTSQVVKENLVKTCQKCHPNANTNFPTAWTSHYVPDVRRWPLVYFVNLFYSIMIPLTIGGMVAFIGLDMARTFINKRQSRRVK